MELKLTIGFIGLFTFVRPGDGAVTYAVLPNTSHQHDGARSDAHGDATAHDLPQHCARLYVSMSDSSLDRRWLGPSLPIDDCILRIGHGGWAGTTPELPRTLFGLRSLTTSDVLPSAVGDAPDRQLVHALVQLRMGGAMETGFPARFTVRRRSDGTVVALRERDTATAWSDTVDSDTLVVELQSLKDGTRIDLKPLILAHAPSGESPSEVVVVLFHAPKTEMPPNPAKSPQPGERLTHFDAYYRLTGGDTSRLPHFEESLGHATPPAALQAMGAVWGGETSSCPNSTDGP